MILPAAVLVQSIVMIAIRESSDISENDRWCGSGGRNRDGKERETEKREENEVKDSGRGRCPLVNRISEDGTLRAQRPFPDPLL